MQVDQASIGTDENYQHIFQILEVDPALNRVGDFVKWTRWSSYDVCASKLLTSWHNKLLVLCVVALRLEIFKAASDLPLWGTSTGGPRAASAGGLAANAAEGQAQPPCMPPPSAASSSAPSSSSGDPAAGVAGSLAESAKRPADGKERAGRSRGETVDEMLGKSANSITIAINILAN